MRIEVICNICVAERQELGLEVEYMEADGTIHVNPINRSQAQNYTCKDCHEKVTIVVFPDDSTNGIKVN